METRNAISGIPIPVPALIGILVVLLLSLAYSVVIGSVGLWLVLVAAVANVGLLFFLLYLFYRLVVAVEKLAENE